MRIFASVVLVLAVVSPGFRKLLGFLAGIIGFVAFLAFVRSCGH